MEHPDYDAFWKREAWVNQLHSSPVPNLNVAGFWDQEDPWGPWQIFRNSAENDPNGNNFMVAGPWFHGQWQRDKEHLIGPITFDGHETAREFRENIEAPFFRHYLHGKGEKLHVEGEHFSIRVEHLASPTMRGRRGRPSHATSICTLMEPCPSKRPPQTAPNSRNTFRTRPIQCLTGSGPSRPPIRRGDWTTWEVADQRFVDHRPDVLSFVSAPLESDLTVTGQLAAELFASTSGTDSDFIVKLIDVYPEDAVKDAWNAGSRTAAGRIRQVAEWV